MHIVTVNRILYEDNERKYLKSSLASLLENLAMSVTKLTIIFHLPPSLA